MWKRWSQNEERGLLDMAKTMTFEVRLPPELSYVDGSFTVNGILVTPSVGPYVISYSWGWGDYTIEFDFEVTEAYEEDREVYLSVMGIIYDAIDLSVISWVCAEI